MPRQVSSSRFQCKLEDALLILSVCHSFVLFHFPQEMHTVIRTYGVACTVRQEKGQDISGACGQLVIDHSGTQGCGNKSSGNGRNNSMRDIEELAAVSCA